MQLITNLWILISSVLPVVSGAPPFERNSAPVCYSDRHMSARNGDKAQFGTRRKRKLARRERAQELKKELQAGRSPAR